MRLKRKKISDSEISQVFDLKKLLKYEPNDMQKELFYNLAVDKMVQRTSFGLDVNNEKFPDYNLDYANKKGVTESSVDLILTGKMLNSFENAEGKNTVEIKIKEDQTGKAHGNITGSYGKPRPVKSKARDFFGFKNSDELSDVLSQVDLLKNPEQESKIDLSEISDLFNRINIGFEGFDG